jgi:hypothetical protein
MIITTRCVHETRHNLYITTQFSRRIIPFPPILLPNSRCSTRLIDNHTCYEIHRNFTSMCVFRLFLNRKVFLLWPIERCKRGLSVRNSPELSSIGLLGLSWLVTVSPGETVDDHVASTVLSRILLYGPIYSCSSFKVYTVGDYSRSTQQVFYTRVLCLMEHGTTSSKHKLLL